MTTQTFDNSETTARLMLQHYVQSVTVDIGDSIEAILLVGSLATDSYVPGPSDIDQITILRDTASFESENKVLKYIEVAKSKFSGNINLAPVVYRSSNFQRPWQSEWDYRRETKHLVCVLEELLRIHDHGQILYGEQFDISQLPKPTIEEMMTYHNRWRMWGNEFAKRHPDFPFLRGDVSPRIAVQIILSRAIFHYYYATRRTCFNKHQIASRLRLEVPNYQFQEGVELATWIRTSGFNDISDEILESLNRWCKRFRQWNEIQLVGSVPTRMN